MIFSSEAVVYFLLFILLGGCFGSFANMAASRLPGGEDLVIKSSHCRRCGYKLTVRDLFPIISWVFLKGKCRKCGYKIGVRYLLLEVALAAAFPLIYLKYGISAQMFILMFTVLCIAIIMAVDFEHYIIPDSMQIALLVAGIGWRFASHAPDFADAAYGALIGLALSLGLKFIYLKFRRMDALGYGDVKLLAICGIWIGVNAFPAFIFFAGFYGVISGLIWQSVTKSPIFPFGPAICASLLQTVIFPESSNFFWYSIGRALP